MKDRSIKHIGEASATDSRLLRAALDQDEAAWSELVRVYGGRIYRWARQGGLLDIDEAEVTNQVFVSVARALPEFLQEEKGSSFRRWLRRITQHAFAAWYGAQNMDICPAVGGSDNRDILQSAADCDGPIIRLPLDLEFTDLTGRARRDGFPRILPREDSAFKAVIDGMSRSLHRRRGNSILLTGLHGVGKVAKIWDLARRAASGEIPFLADKRFLWLDCRQIPLPAGTQARLYYWRL